MSKPVFGVTYDYRCPFARNAHEHLVVALRGGADWDVEFTPFSLSQAHVEEGGLPVWDDPAKAPDLLAIEAGLVVRDEFPDKFYDVHLGLFTARHDRGLDLRDESAHRGRRRSPPDLSQGARDGGGQPSGLRRPHLRGRRQGGLRPHHDPAR
ncbi:MAG: hypothetical protein ABSC30_17760 [Acidimicrobiales bacterium]